MKLRIAIPHARLLGRVWPERRTRRRIAASDDVPKEYAVRRRACAASGSTRCRAKQQPAPTDCPTAVKNRPPNGKVIFGDDYAETAQTRAKTRSCRFIKKFGDDRKKP